MKKLILMVSMLVMATSGNLLAQDTKTITNDSIQKSLASLKKDLDLLKKLKINGWIQAQLQFADSSGQQSYDGGNFAPNSDKRFMIRRGRFKFTYANQLSEY